MTRKIFALASLAGLLVSCDTKEPGLQCTVGHAATYVGGGSFTATYFLKANQPKTAACAKLSGEVLGMESYHGITQTIDGPMPDSNAVTLAIRTSTLGNVDANGCNDGVNAVTSVGDYTPEPTQSVCFAPQLARAEQHAAATADCPAVDIAYRWRNVKVIVRADVPGTEMSADLTYSDGSCTAEYKALGVWPAVSCVSGQDAAGNNVFDSGLCSPVPVPQVGRAYGSGLNPSFPVVCNTDIGNCVLSATPPELADPELPGSTVYTISGNVVTKDGAALQFVEAEAGAGSVLSSGLTDPSGNYSIGALVNADWTVTPRKANWTFDSKSLPVTIKDGAVGNINFKATCGAALCDPTTCADLTSDVAHCGDCGISCKPGQGCADSACSCDPYDEDTTYCWGASPRPAGCASQDALNALCPTGKVCTKLKTSTDPDPATYGGVCK